MPAIGFGGGAGAAGAVAELPVEDDMFDGDMSSIMIKPDQILHDQNIANE